MYKYSDVFIAVTYHITFPTHKISRNEHSRFLWQQRMRISLCQWSLSRNSIEWKVFIVALTSGHLPSWRELSSLVSDTGPIGSLHEIMPPLTDFKVLSSKDGRNRDYASSGATVCIGILMSDVCLCKLHGISSFLNYSWHYVCAHSTQSFRRCYSSWYTNDPVTAGNSAKHQRWLVWSPNINK